MRTSTLWCVGEVPAAEASNQDGADSIATCLLLLIV
jgi:hypothetical protein